jgi:hypothetical protein
MPSRRPAKGSPPRFLFVVSASHLGTGTGTFVLSQSQNPRATVGLTCSPVQNTAYGLPRSHAEHVAERAGPAEARGASSWAQSGSTGGGGGAKRTASTAYESTDITQTSVLTWLYIVATEIRRKATPRERRTKRRRERRRVRGQLGGGGGMHI